MGKHEADGQIRCGVACRLRARRRRYPRAARAGGKGARLCHRRGRGHRSAALPGLPRQGDRLAKPYNARIIVRAKPDMKEGTPVQGNVVITSFDSLADAEKWYGTPPYKDLVAERQKSS